jgi:hypothetical protein
MMAFVFGLTAFGTIQSVLTAAHEIQGLLRSAITARTVEWLFRVEKYPLLFKLFHLSHNVRILEYVKVAYFFLLFHKLTLTVQFVTEGRISFASIIQVIYKKRR